MKNIKRQDILLAKQLEMAKTESDQGQNNPSPPEDEFHKIIAEMEQRGITTQLEKELRKKK